MVKHSPRSNCLILPEELWLEILSYFRSTQDVKQLSRCSKALRSIAVTILFKTVIVRPFSGNQGLFRETLALVGLSRVPKPQDYLQTLTKSHIAHIIETFAILPSGITLQNTHQDPTETPVSIIPVIDQIFTLLLGLPRLNRLVCVHAALSENVLNAIVRLPLKQLELRNCFLSGDSFVGAQGSGTLESVKVSFASDIRASYPARASLFAGLFANAKNLRSIYGTSINDILSTIIHTHPPALTSLSLSTASTTCPHFVPALEICTSLKFISLRSHRSQVTLSPRSPLQPGSLPNLEHYVGPAPLIPYFTEGRPSIKRINLIDTIDSNNPAALIARVPRTLDSFTLTSATRAARFIRAVHSHFALGSLERFTIRCEAPSPDFHYLPRALADSDDTPLPSVRYFTFRAYLGLRPRQENFVKGYIAKLLMVYRNLEEARFIHLKDTGQGSECVVGWSWVWSRGGPDSPLGSLRFVDVEDESYNHDNRDSYWKDMNPL
ncbi:hypothetical protein BDN72DRAFT_959858 [Pluteus cervinus]|uniref:Uncharacterized protein n=1 Tax=Pluteus cervinus TaxID=181527 RepID=A0ACD3ATV8_9AGAR|nr:hypothetical protein BDN72DRAFT_959858 [Pluteus cervinus]